MLDSSLSPLTAPPPAGLSPLRVLVLALMPSEQNFTQIAAHPQATAGRAYLWLAMAFVVGSGLSTLIGLGLRAVFGPNLPSALPTFPAAPLTLSSAAFDLICGVPVGAVELLIGATLVVGLSHLLARLLGGAGRFGPLLYSYAAFYAPLFIVASLLQSLPYLNLLNLITGLYALVLSVVATKTVHRLGWAKAAIAGLLIPLLAMALYLGLVAGVLALTAYALK